MNLLIGCLTLGAVFAVAMLIVWSLCRISALSDAAVEEMREQQEGRGAEVAREAHNLEAAGSSPAAPTSCHSADVHCWGSGGIGPSPDD